MKKNAGFFADNIHEMDVDSKRRDFGTFFDAAEGGFETAKVRYGTWPLTVWRLRDSDRHASRLKRDVRDTGKNRTNAESSYTFMSSIAPSTTGASTSIFSPELANLILALYTRKGACVVYDPFAGGGTRAIACTSDRHTYIGVELNKKEVEAVRNNLRVRGLHKRATIHHGDAKVPIAVKSNSADFLITCPPYWNLERYGNGNDDLSMAGTYDDFLAGMGKVIYHCRRVLKPGSLACWVVGMCRDPETSELIPIHHDIVRLHKRHGFRLKEEVVVYKDNPGPILRSGNFEKGNNYLVRTHEYCLVFQRP